jgi:hypothetical protein
MLGKVFVDGGESLSATEPADQQKLEKTKTVYTELCNSYRAIDDFRAKLLGFLPLATGAGIFLLVANNQTLDLMQQYALPIGFFGIFITLGLFFYELYGIRKCGALIDAGCQIEHDLGIVGQFRTRPYALARILDEPFAAGVIYPAVLAAWTYLTFIFVWPQTALWLALLVFSVGPAGTFMYDRWLQSKPSACEETETTH